MVDGLASDLARAQVLVTQQRSGLLAVRAATARRKELRQEVLVPLRQLATIAHAAAVAVPELGERFVPPARGISHRAYLTATRAMSTEAQAHRDLLLSHGMAPTLLDDVARTLDEYEPTIDQTHTGRRDHLGARSDLDTVVGSIMARIEQRDVINRYRFRKQPEQLAAWLSARDMPWPGKGPVTAPDKAKERRRERKVECGGRVTRCRRAVSGTVPASEYRLPSTEYKQQTAGAELVPATGWPHPLTSS